MNYAGSIESLFSNDEIIQTVRTCGVSQKHKIMQLSFLAYFIDNSNVGRKIDSIFLEYPFMVGKKEQWKPDILISYIEDERRIIQIIEVETLNVSNQKLTGIYGNKGELTRISKKENKIVKAMRNSLDDIFSDPVDALRFSVAFNGEDLLYSEIEERINTFKRNFEESYPKPKIERYERQDLYAYVFSGYPDDIDRRSLEETVLLIEKDPQSLFIRFPWEL